MKRLTRIACALLLSSPSAMAALPPDQLDSVGITLPPNAGFPLFLSAPDLSGARRSIGEALGGHPGFVLFADYTCKALCGPALVLLTTALANSDLSPESYRVIVIGLDPKDTAGDARRMRDAQVPEALRRKIIFLLPDGGTVSAAAHAVGFRYVYDKSVDQFAHPELAYAVAADGRVRRLVSPFALTASNVKADLLAPVAPQSLYDRVRLICYRFGVLRGPYSARIENALQAVAGLTLVIFAGAIFLLHKRSRG